MLAKQFKNLFWIWKPFGIPFGQKLRILIGPGGGWQHQHTVNRNLLTTEISDDFSGLSRGLALMLLDPDAHRPKYGLTGASGQLRVLVQDFGGFAGKNKQVERDVFERDQILVGMFITQIMRDQTKRIGIHTPARWTPGQR